MALHTPVRAGEHTLHARHTSAPLSLAAGIPIGNVSERLGHSKTSITLDVYVHALLGQHREAADKLADAMFGAGRS